MKKIWMMTAALWLGIWLTGCSPAFVPVEDPSESQTEERNSPETEKEDQREDLAFQPISEEERRRIVTELYSILAIVNVSSFSLSVFKNFTSPAASSA